MIAGIKRFAPLLALALLPQRTHAFTMSVGGFGPTITLPTMLQNVITVLMASAYIVCTAIFIAGAFFYITSAGAEDRKGFGKSMMVGSLIGAIVITGARGIMNTVLLFIYG